MQGSSKRRATSLRILLVDSDDSSVRSVTSHIDELEGVELVGFAADPEKGMRLVHRERPDVVLIELPAVPAVALDMATRLSAAFPDVQILASSAEIRPDLLRRAMRGGVRELLSRPIDVHELDDALEHSRGIHAARLEGRLEMAKTIAFFGAGGGLGTTTLAVNTAVTLALQAPGRVLIADFDLGGGDVPIFLDLDEPAMTFMDLISRARPRGSLPALLASHRSGLHALPGPQRIEELEAVGGEELSRAWSLCRVDFSLIVVDLGHAITDAAVAVLERADRIYLVTQMALPSLQGAARRVDLFARLGYPPERCSVILNRGSRCANISLREAEQIVGTEIDLEIGNDYRAALAAIDSGVPLVEQRRGRGLRRAIQAIARRHLDTACADEAAAQPTPETVES